MLLDRLIIALSGLVVILLVTGGVHFQIGHAKIELSQIDPFSIPLFLLLLLRYKKTGELLPTKIFFLWEKALKLLKKSPLKSVIIGFAIYVGLYSLLQAVRYASFNASAFDMSYIDQSLWNTVYGSGFLHSSLSRGNTYLGEHFTPLLGTLAPFYLIWDSIYMLFVLQSVLLGLNAFLVYKLARIKNLQPYVATLLALCFLLYHPLRAANSFDFREDNFYVAIFLSVLIFWETKNWLCFWAFCCLSWLIKENAPLFTLMISLWMIFLERKKLKSSNPTLIKACILFSLSILIFWTVNSKITPYFSGPRSQTMLTIRLHQFGSNNHEILMTMLTRPHLVLLEFFKVFFSKESIRYLLVVFVPFAAFAKKSKPAFLIACAGASLNLIMNANKIGFHYECVLIPFLFYSLIHGVKHTKLNSQTLFMVFFSFFLFFGRSPLDDIRRLWPTERDRWIAHELDKIPENASVATQSVIHPHLTHRLSIAMISPQMNEDYIVADLDSSRSRYANDNLEADVAGIDPKRYEKLVDKDHFQIWKKR